MGTTMYFVLMSEKPEYNKKIHVAQLMAPIAYMKNVRSLLLRFLAPLSKEFTVAIIIIIIIIITF